MILSEFTNRFLQRKINKALVFIGPEIRIMDTFIKKISEDYQLEIKRIDTVQEIMTRIQSKNMLGNSKKLYIIREDKEVMEVENIMEKLNLLLDEDRIILIYNDIDKRKKFYKESNAVEFDYLDEEVLVQYLKPYLKQVEARKLVKMCERDYNRIMIELNKIEIYAKINKCDNEWSFELLKRQGMIYEPVGDIIFEMTDNVVLKKPHDAYNLLYKLYQKGEAPIKIISILYTNFRNLLIVQGTEDGAGIVERTGLTPWQVKLAKEKKGIWNNNKIKSILKILQDCESGIKNGKYDDRTAIEVAMIGILG